MHQSSITKEIRYLWTVYKQLKAFLWLCSTEKLRECYFSYLINVYFLFYFTALEHTRYTTISVTTALNWISFSVHHSPLLSRTTTLKLLKEVFNLNSTYIYITLVLKWKGNISLFLIRGSTTKYPPFWINYWTSWGITKCVTWILKLQLFCMIS